MGQHRCRFARLSVALLALLSVAVAPAAAEEPAERIAAFVDSRIDAQLKGAGIPASPVAGDSEFLRRAYLDLIGHLPPYEQASAFLADADPQKRAKLIASLVGDAAFGEHQAALWSELLLGPETKYSDRLRFRKWLAGRFNAGDGWDEIAYDLLTAVGEPAKVEAALFTAAQSEGNQVQPNLLAAAVSRHFLGVQLQCAECHDHPFAEWKQTDFWGVAAFFSRVQNVRPNKNSPDAGVLEVLPKADDKKSKESDRKESDKNDDKEQSSEPLVAIRIPNTAGKASGSLVKARFLLADEPMFEKPAPARPTFAAWATAHENPYFVRAAANRLWAQLFGRGLVSPVDDMHAGNPASHPELLDRLADELRASGFNLKLLAQGLAMSRAYQRSSAPLPENAEDQTLYSHAAVKVMSSETLYDALVRGLGAKDLDVSFDGLPTVGVTGVSQRGKLPPREQFARFFKTGEIDSPATEFTQGIPQALSLLNEPQFVDGGPLVASLVKESASDDEAIERLTMTILSRRPTEAEKTALARYLQSSTDRQRGVAGVSWILLNMPEFMLIR